MILSSNPMITKLIRTLVVAFVLWLVYLVAGLVVAAVHGPALVLTIVAVILLLSFIVFVCREFGIIDVNDV